MPQRNNPMSAVQKKRTVSTTKKKGTTSSSKTSRTSKKEQMKHRTVMPVWIRNILAVVIVGCFSVVFYYFFIRPYAYRWKPCHGLKEYGVCIPDGYDIHGIDISHYQGKIDWKRLLQNKETATPLHFVFVKPILYTSYKFKTRYLDDSIFNTYPYWIAHYYVDSVKYQGKWDFWQHTDVGSVPGIKEDVDLNVFNGSLEELKKLTIK